MFIPKKRNEKGKKENENKSNRNISADTVSGIKHHGI